MGFILMSHWTLFLLLLPSVLALGHPRYECGENGRFEYCIDGIPGCIVGCHCHPGYYFDTETKICEPNSKLVEEYRRLYLPEPTRVQIPLTPTEVYETTPTPTTTNVLDNQVDAIAKDTDDLGDWLYNQFFKTIENQVINNTDDKPLTRRSGSGSSPKKTKKTRKKMKLKPKKFKFNKITKKKDLRRKLLRITEDDSLFDSNSDSEEAESDASSSSGSNSDTSLEFDKDNHSKDKEHGHRKILVINKKPKPPLPSFIFLPNMETAFFPPIGLPPPPVIPMYPMVPVPPMPLIPSVATAETPVPEAHIRILDESTCPAWRFGQIPPQCVVSPEDMPTTTAAASTLTTEFHVTTTTALPTNATTPEIDSDAMFRSHNEKKRAQRKKMLRQLQDKIQNSKIFITPLPQPRNRKISSKFGSHNSEDPDDFNDETFLNDMKFKRIDDEHDRHKAEDVGFKYLSQLIHKVDPNITNEIIKHNVHKLLKPKSRFETSYYDADIQPVINYSGQHKQTRKFYNDEFRAKPNEVEDRYYSNLGQQIANLIRKIDVTGQANTQAASNQNDQDQSFYGDRDNAPRPYWERSVRSPLNYFRPYTSKNEFDYFHNNYENLLNLENKVKVVATTEHSLSLQELENVIFLMDKAKSQLKTRIKNLKRTNNDNLSPRQNLNVNLLPRQNDISKIHLNLNNHRRNNEHLLPRTYEVKIEKPTTKTLEYNNADDYTVNANNIHYNLRGILMHNFKNMLQTKPDIQKNSNESHVQSNSPNIGKISGNKITKTTNRPKTKPAVPPPYVDRHSNIFVVNAKAPMKRIKQTYINSINPSRGLLMPYFKNTPQRHKNKSRYSEKVSLPFQFALSPKKGKNPSYFHHELHHFDYFE